MTIKPKVTTVNSNLMAILFLASGIAMLALSIFAASQIVAFIGIGLTFWGALFLLIAPQRHVEGTFLENTAIPFYMTLDRTIKDFAPKGEAYCIPPYPRDVYVPEHLKGLKEIVVFIPAENAVGIASIEELAKGKFSIENPKGILVGAPGAVFIEKIEQKRNTDFTKIPFSELTEVLPHLLSELNLTKEITMTANENEATLQITDSLFKNLYSEKYSLKSVRLIGCPVVNAVSCAIAKSTGKPVAIQKIKNSPDGQTIVATFKIVQL
jgi:hypothetical protein